MRQFLVTGMTCAACQARVEKAVSHVPGVTSAAVSLLTNSMGVEGTASDEAIIRAVTEAGYGASVKDGKRDADALSDRETPLLRKRLFAGLGFLLVLMYLSMGFSMWHFPLPEVLSQNLAAVGFCEWILATCIIVINRKFFISGTKSLLHGAPNMDTLVSLGSSASYLWSVYALIRLTMAQADNRPDAARMWLDLCYFGSAAMILVLITVGKLLEAKSKGKTTDALRALMELSPKTACVLRDGKETAIPAEEIRRGDLFLVRPGESIPADGIVKEGDTAVNEAALTGESIPVDKAPGDRVSAATVNQSGRIVCEATRVGEDTALAQIIKTVSDAAATKAPIARLADRVAGIFVPTVTGIAVVTLVVWMILGRPFAFSLERAIAVLVISCPCALGLATPVAVMVAGGVGARHGILYKTAQAIEEAGKIGIVVLDKTGTVTHGMPEITEVIPAAGISTEELLITACSLEACSEHPLAGAVMREAERRGIQPKPVDGFRAFPGNGLTATLDGKTVYGGSLSFIAKQLPPGMTADAEAAAARGETPILFSENGKLLGTLAAADLMKEEAPAAVAELEAMGIRVVMLTGDTGPTAEAVCKKAGIRYFAAEVLPNRKEEIVRRLKTLGKTAMVGDGINDAPALTSADTGIAIGAGTDIAIDSADIVLVNSRLSDVPMLICLSRAALRNIKENLFWAFFYNALCIPLAACFMLDPMIGAAAMSLSSFCVVTNALRLNLFSPKPGKHGKKPGNSEDAEKIRILLEEYQKKTEDMTMTKTLKIDGMMCPRCEAHVKKALEALDGVESAIASHEKGTAVITLSRSIDEAILKKAVEDDGYTFLGIE